MKDIRNDFPQLKRKINGKQLVYLDSSATSLKPQSVIDALTGYYTDYTANVFRGIYTTSEEATAAYEGARGKVAGFISAPSPGEIVFTRNATESLNLLAAGIGKTLQEGDEIITTIMEHHSNFVPWQQRALKKNVKLKIWDLDQHGKLDLAQLNKLITRRTKVLTITAVSNVLGTICPIAQICQIVKHINPECLVFVDAAQAVPHMVVDVIDWGVDAIVFSGHKLLGPTGIGVLWAKMSLLESLSPYQYGGDMIEEVHREKTIFKSPPHKFEAGTPHIAGAIGLGAAIEYLQTLGLDAVRRHEIEITDYALKALARFKGVTVYGPDHAKDRGGVIAFRLEGVHPHDIAQVLDESGICIRVGFHCAQPLHEFLGIGPTARASFYVYTMKKDIDTLIAGLEKVKKLFS